MSVCMALYTDTSGTRCSCKCRKKTRPIDYKTHELTYEYYIVYEYERPVWVYPVCYVYRNVRVYVFIYVHIYTYKSSQFQCTSCAVYIGICICMWNREYIHIRLQAASVNEPHVLCIFKFVRVCIYMRVYIYTYMYLYMYMYMYLYIYICIYIYMYMNVDMHDSSIIAWGHTSEQVWWWKQIHIWIRRVTEFKWVMSHIRMTHSTFNVTCINESWFTYE